VVSSTINYITNTVSDTRHTSRSLSKNEAAVLLLLTNSQYMIAGGYGMSFSNWEIAGGYGMSFSNGSVARTSD
jgi:hypothetical protein